MSARNGRPIPLDQQVTLEVDGRPVTAAAGESLLDSFARAGIEMTHICYHPALGPIQTCDTCIVEIDGELQRSCATEAREGLVVVTNGETSHRVRQEAMQRLLANHELYCTVCDFNNQDCPVHKVSKQLDINHQKYPFKKKPYAVDDSNPFYRYDPHQCILCGRCVEACQNVQVTETLSINWDDPHPRVQWDGGATIGDSSCVSCGHCVTVCPCNALLEKSMVGEAGYLTFIPDPVLRPVIELVKASEKLIGYDPLFLLSDAEATLRMAQRIEINKTVCTYCGVGCAFDVWTKDRQILKIDATGEGPANGISTCVKGKFGWDFVNSDARLTAPLIRENDRHRRATWDEALSTVANRLRAIADEHGPDSVGFIASSKCTNEESYLTQKLARAVFGTNNVDNCSRYCQAPATNGLWRTVGYGGDAGSIEDMVNAELVFIVGSNTSASHPVLAAKLRRAQKLKGQKHIVADLRRHDIADRADLFLRPNPGTDLVWLSAVANYIVMNGLEDDAFIEKWVHDFDKYKASLEPFTLDLAESITGIPSDQIRQAAEMIAAAETVCGLWAMGVTQHRMGSDTSTAVSNLLLLTGNFGRPGTGGYPLRGHNNVQGASDFGSINTYFPGYQEVSDLAVREKFSDAWGVPLSAEKGLDNRLMIDAIHEGKLKALFVVGEELSLVDANISYVQEALRKLDFFAVQDIFMSHTAHFADVVLAASPSLEKDGTFVNTERRIQRLYKVFDPLDGSRPDWIILRDLAHYLGHDWSYNHPSDIMDEIASLTPLFAGVNYERLAGYRSLQWPVAADGRDTPLLYTERFQFPDGKARFYPLTWMPPSDRPDAEHKYHLNNGRLLEHFHEGNMTYKSDGIASIVPGVFVEVSTELAETQGLQSGDWVRLNNDRGTVDVRVLVSDLVRGNELYLPMHSRQHTINTLTSNVIDPDSNTPAYKEVSVSLTRLNRQGAKPLHHDHPRYGNPTPIRGVRVEMKWDRSDYVFPTRERPEGGQV